MSIVGDAYRAMVEAHRRRQLRKTFRHISGPRQVTLGKDQIGLVLLGRNNAYFLEECVRYHRQMGVDHVVYVDNESTDSSVEIASSLPNTTVAVCSASFRDYQKYIRRLAVTEYLKGGWRLAIDCDEIFDYPHSDKVSLHDLVRRLDAGGYSGMISYMLEMVPSDPVRNYDETVPFSQVRKAFSGYSLDGIESYDYSSADAPLAYFLQQNQISGVGLPILFGGIRRQVFGENCCLIKHPLFKMSGNIDPMAHPHVTTGLRCPSFTGILHHYKFAGGVVQREQKLIEQKRLSHNEAESRAKAFADNSDLSFAPFITGHNPDPTVMLQHGVVDWCPEAEKLIGHPLPGSSGASRSTT
ncbi:MAG: glycosyltransferase family 2 protein [Paracoccus sp. (in: a-proteobacteria)]|uniref:glycosyltransferase family 2 protein n=1 Tax=Paracoccus sp. TaxID=267 RepID=UPI0026DF3812|nr:glycosyltransferase family 2 protein [Paracoccus sp. (in: a-proteobacteria)]MDO5612411.1 glycosyltransferase family 2 protein [Paracoccus sp. (in: a-proteobacteria)]